MKKSLFYLLLTLFGTAAIVKGSAENPFPVIGVLSVPSQFEEYNSFEWNYISVSAIKFIESGGARVVPVQWDLPIDTLNNLLRSVNGLFIPNANSDILFAEYSEIHLAFRQSVEKIITIVGNMNDEGIILPLFGSGMGFQAIACSFASQERGDYACLSEYEGFESARKNLTLISIANRTSILSSSLLADVTAALEEKEIAYTDTKYLVDVDLWNSTAKIYNNFAIVAYFDNTTIPAAIISKQHRIYATQFSVESPQYEWSLIGNIPHSYEAVVSSQMFANFFVEQSRQNFNNFDKLGFTPEDMSVRDNNTPVMLKNSPVSKIYLFNAFGLPSVNLEAVIADL